MRHGFAVFVLILLNASCGPTGTEPDGRPAVVDAGFADGAVCTDGTTSCEGAVVLNCVSGQFQPGETCDSVCVPNLGCVECVPGTGTCNGNVSTACTPDGLGYKDYVCDPVQGVTCNQGTGLCEGACAPQDLGESYIGCEYYPTITGNIVDSNFTFAVIVSNTTAQPASVTIEGGAEPMPITFSVPAGSAVVRELAWVPSLKGCTSFGEPACGFTTETSVLAVGGAYRLRTTAPVTVYQFNPLDYIKDTQYSITNDASLLFPTNAMRQSYMAASYPKWNIFDGANPSLLSVTATQDQTEVTITTTAAVAAGPTVDAFTPGLAKTVTLARGDVLELFSFDGDLTGSTVTATAPIQVVSGHYCTQVPNGTPACDHLEESMFPLEALGARYLVTAPAVPSLPMGKPRLIRIIAVEGPTTVTYDPPQAGAPTAIAGAGQFIEIPTSAESFAVEGDRRIMVVEYMLGQNAGGDTGDPAMALAVPIAQFRNNYLFHAPLSYESNYVNVVAPTGATITLDGAPVTGFTPIGSTGSSLARVLLGEGQAGTHSITGTQPFGITVYGYGRYTSYWYPGGLDLRPVEIE